MPTRPGATPLANRLDRPVICMLTSTSNMATSMYCAPLFWRSWAKSALLIAQAA
ncbi:hypothetical protein D3C81_1912220 [compost metagenome]